MKKIYILVTAIFCFYNSVYSQGWEEVGTGSNALKANAAIYVTCTDVDGTLYAAGSFTDSVLNTSGHRHVAKWNGTEWSILGTGANALNAAGAISTMCIDAAHNVYVAGGTIKDGRWYVAKWDGTTWSEVGMGIDTLHANGPIHSICLDPSGNLYAAGLFSSGGYKYVAKWDGANWTQLGAGTDTLKATTDINSIVADAAGNIYAAGDFTLSGYCYVAKWDGTEWSIVGPLGFIHTIWTLHIDAEGYLYAGGFFTNAGGKKYVAKWNGTAWSEVGAGANALNANGAIYRIVSDKHGNLYATGAFSNSWGNAIARKWNGSTWADVGEGLDGLDANADVFAMCIDTASGTLYVGGGFTDGTNSGDGYNYVAKYTLPASIQGYETGGVLLFPNPAGNMLNVNTKNLLQSAIFNITDITGRQVMQGSMTNGQIDISGIAAGSYYLTLSNNDYVKRSVFIKR